MLGPVHPIQPSFAAGELSPPVRSRVDLDKRDIGLEVCKNFITRPHGGAVNRPGFEFYGETKDSSKRSRLIPFVFSMDSTECYAMEVGHEYIRFYTANGQVVFGGDDPSIPVWEPGTTYEENDLVRWQGHVYKCISGPVTGVGSALTPSSAFATGYASPYVPNNAIDGSSMTWWRSDTSGQAVYTTETAIGVDLGSSKSVGRIYLYHGVGVANMVEAVEVQYKSGGSWVTLMTVDVGDATQPVIDLMEDLVAVSAQEWRLKAVLNGHPYTDTPTSGWDVMTLTLYEGVDPSQDATHWEALTTFEVTTPFQEADLPDVRYVQSADVMYLTHHDYPIMTLSRYGHVSWLLEEFPFTGGPFQDINDDESATVSMTGFAQKAYPASDYATGSWATAPLYSKLDEEPYSDSDAISVSGAISECKLTLDTLEEPTSRDGHVLRVRAKCSRSGRKLTVNLYSGTTLIYSKNVFLATAYGVYELAIPPSVAELITSYSTVRVGLKNDSTAYTTSVSWVCFQTPKGSSGGGVEVTDGPFSAGDSVIIEASDDIFEADMEGCLFMAEYLTPGSSQQVQIPDSTDYTSPEYRLRGKWTFRTTSGGDWDNSTIYLDKSIDEGKTWHQFKALSYRITTNWLIEGTEEDEEFLLRVRRPTVTSDHPYFYIEVPDFRERAVVRITKYVSATQVEGVLENRLWTLPTSTDVWAFGSWSDKYGYPAVSAFYQERLVFANTPTDPQRIWMSRSGDYPDFGVSLPLKDDDAVDIPIPSREVNAITGIVALTDLVVMSAGGQWKVAPGTTSEAITPSEKVAKPQNYTRSSKLPPLVVGNRVVFLEGMDAKVFDLGYSLEDDSYAGSDLSVLSEHLFEGHSVVDWAFQQAPYSVVWAVRDDGVLLGMTYLREHQVVAWHHHHTDGVFESICTIPGDGEDQLWAIVRRTINGSTKRYVERLHSRRFATLADAFFVDSGLSYDGSPITHVTNLGHLEGKTVVALANGTVVRDLVVTSASVDLPSAASKIHVGLAYDCDLCTLEDAIELKDGISIPKKKNTPQALLLVNNSAGGQVGPDADHLNDLDYEGHDQPYTGKLRPQMESGWDDEGKVYIRQSDPLPFGIDGIVRRVSYGG